MGSGTESASERACVRSAQRIEEMKRAASTRGIRLHYAPAGVALCGQTGSGFAGTDRIEDATCRRCVKLLYAAAVQAHYRAFPELRGPRGRRVGAAILRAGIEREVRE